MKTLGGRVSPMKPDLKECPVMRDASEMTSHAGALRLHSVVEDAGYVTLPNLDAVGLSRVRRV
jgi:hypothetical protein